MSLGIELFMTFYKKSVSINSFIGKFVSCMLQILIACKRKQNIFFLQDSLQQKDERIEELEEALRESVQITAEREMVLAQEESARANAEKQVRNTKDR